MGPDLGPPIPLSNKIETCARVSGESRALLLSEVRGIYPLQAALAASRQLVLLRRPSLGLKAFSHVPWTRVPCKLTLEFPYHLVAPSMAVRYGLNENKKRALRKWLQWFPSFPSGSHRNRGTLILRHHHHRTPTWASFKTGDTSTCLASLSLSLCGAALSEQEFWNSSAERVPWPKILATLPSFRNKHVHLLSR